MPALGWRFPSELPDFNLPLGWPMVMNVLSWTQQETKTNPVVKSEHQSREIGGFLNWFLQSHNRKARKVIFRRWMLTVLIFWFNIPDSRGASLMTLTGQLLTPLLLTPFRAWSGHFTHEGRWGGSCCIHPAGSPGFTPTSARAHILKGETFQWKSSLDECACTPSDWPQSLVTVSIIHL